MIPIKNRKNQELIHITSFFISTVIYYVSIICFIYVSEKYNIFKSGYYIDSKQIVSHSYISIILLGSIIIGSMCLITNYFIFSKVYNNLSNIYGNLPKIDIALKILCYINCCLIIRISSSSFTCIMVSLPLIIISLVLSNIIRIKMKKIITSKSIPEIDCITRKNTIHISNEQKIKYEQAQKIFKIMFWTIILFFAVLLRHLFSNITLLVTGLISIYIIIILMSYKAYSLIFNQKDLLINMANKGLISALSIVFVVLLYNHTIIIPFYPSVSNDELGWMILIPLLLLQIPAQKVYIGLRDINSN